MKEVNTISGKTYSVHTMKGCTIIEPDGWQKTIEAPDGYFDAHFGSVVIEGDDEASIKQLFKLAPYQKLRLLGVVGGNADGLPAGYKRVEYLQSQRNMQIIITDYIPDNETGIFVSASFNSAIDDTSSNTMLVGSRTDMQTDSRFFTPRICQYPSSGTTGYGWGTWKAYPYNYRTGIFKYESSINWLNNRRALLVFENEEATIDDNLSVLPFTPTIALALFGLNLKDSRELGSARSIYEAKFSQGDRIVRDFVPCLDPTGAPCMFDLVSRQPFYNSGSGDFLYPTESTTYSLRRVLPDWGKLTERGLRRLYHAPESYNGDIADYALENGYKPIIEPERPDEGYWSPRWTETDDEIVLEWVETEPPMDEPLTRTE